MEKIDVKMKHGVNTAEISSKSKQTLGGREISVQGPNKQQDVVKFKFVPLEVPNLELIHLIRSFGGKIKQWAEMIHEKVAMTNLATGEVVNLRSASRSIEASFPTNRRPYNFFWLSGAGRDDRPQRIVCQGSSNRQCGNCLRWSNPPQTLADLAAKQVNAVGRESGVL